MIHVSYIADSCRTFSGELQLCSYFADRQEVDRVQRRCCRCRRESWIFLKVRRHLMAYRELTLRLVCIIIIAMASEIHVYKL